MVTAADLTTQVEEGLLTRNRLFEPFFAREAPRLAAACREMSERFLRGGRLLAFGRGCYATDAQHVAVEFVHPVIVGKRALPALDLSPLFRPWLEAIVQRDDMVMGFGPPEGDAEVTAALRLAHARRAMTFALPGTSGSYATPAATADPFVHQELMEILYHTLWESVHVFFEHRELGHEVGQAGFLYPFLGRERQESPSLLVDVAASIRMKVQDDATLRARKRKLLTVALLGYDGGEIKRQGLADHFIVVRSDDVPRIQEVQASIYHLLRESLEALGRGQA